MIRLLKIIINIDHSFLEKLCKNYISNLSLLEFMYFTFFTFKVFNICTVALNLLLLIQYGANMSYKEMKFIISNVS